MHAKEVAPIEPVRGRFEDVVTISVETIAENSRHLHISVVAPVEDRGDEETDRCDEREDGSGQQQPHAPSTRILVAGDSKAFDVHERFIGKDRHANSDEHS